MYAKLNYNADVGNDAEQVLADLTAILTGETLVGNLVGSLNLGTSIIDTSYTPVAWTLYDDVSLSTKVFQIPVHDDVAQFFYVELFAYNTTEIHIRLWETWDNTGHTGTGASYYYYTSSQIIMCTSFSTTPFNLYISATARHIIVRSEYGAGLKKYLRGMIQYDRGEAWDTAAVGYKPVVVTYADTFATGQFYTLPHKRSDSSVYTLSSGGLYMHIRYGNSQLDDLALLTGNNSGAARGLNASGDSVHNMYECGASYLSSGERFLTGKFHDIYLATYQNGGFGDIVSVGGFDYIIWESDTNYRMAVRKG